MPLDFFGQLRETAGSLFEKAKTGGTIVTLRAQQEALLRKIAKCALASYNAGVYNYSEELLDLCKAYWSNESLIEELQFDENPDDIAANTVSRSTAAPPASGDEGVDPHSESDKSEGE